MYYIIIMINYVYYYVIKCVKLLNHNCYVLCVDCFDPNVFWIFIERFIVCYMFYIKTCTAQNYVLKARISSKIIGPILLKMPYTISLFWTLRHFTNWLFSRKTTFPDPFGYQKPHKNYIFIFIWSWNYHISFFFVFL